MDVFWKHSKFRYISICIFITFLISCLIGIAPISIDKCNCDIYNGSPKLGSQDSATNDQNFEKSNHRLAILVPFRDRFEELLSFAPHIYDFLNRQNIPHRIFIINQEDAYRFNRASLINVGFLQVRKNFDYIAMHDVDLLPMNDQLSYGYPEKGPFHVASPDLHPRYHYPTFVGGILLINREHFALVNGMSNKYWGWGLEDDEFYVRLKEVSLNITRPENITTGMQNTFKHIHDKNRRKRDMATCYNQREVTRRRDRQTGLHDVSYKLLGITEMTVNKTPLTILRVSLNCDKSLTPWCQCIKSDGTKEGQLKRDQNSKKAGPTL